MYGYFRKLKKSMRLGELYPLVPQSTLFDFYFLRFFLSNFTVSIQGSTSEVWSTHTKCTTATLAPNTRTISSRSLRRQQLRRRNTEVARGIKSSKIFYCKLLIIIQIFIIKKNGSIYFSETRSIKNKTHITNHFNFLFCIIYFLQNYFILSFSTKNRSKSRNLSLIYKFSMKRNCLYYSIFSKKS